MTDHNKPKDSSQNHQKDHEGGHHFILPEKWAIGVGAALLLLTLITVVTAQYDFGWFNFPLAMFLASSKAFLVAGIFMNLVFDKKENALIFATSFLFLIIFGAFTVTDIYFRGDVNVSKKELMASMASTAKSTLKKPWVSTPELIEKGKGLYAAQCAACHGGEGKGDGPAAAAANPKPRNFHASEGWKLGRKPSQIFMAIRDGIPNSIMSSFASIPSDDRWALTHYVASLGGDVPADTTEDLGKIGIDPSQDSAAEEVKAASIPIKLAMKRVAVEDTSDAFAEISQPAKSNLDFSQMKHVEKIYQNRCAQCHGVEGQGEIRVKSLGVSPVAYVKTLPFSKAPSMKDYASFEKVVVNGLPGDLMPAAADLSGAELRELYQWLKVR